MRGERKAQVAVWREELEEFPLDAPGPASSGEMVAEKDNLMIFAHDDRQMELALDEADLLVKLEVDPRLR